MALMCEECKCSTYLNEETGMYSCESGCACCNDPDYESDWDTHLRIMKQIIEYAKLHKLSLLQDSQKLGEQMDATPDMDSDEYKQLEIEEISVTGQMIGVDHILQFIYELDKSPYEGVK